MRIDDRPNVPCGLCGTPTPMTGTKRCNRCWELESRIYGDPALAQKILDGMKQQDGGETWNRERIEAVASRVERAGDKEAADLIRDLLEAGVEAEQERIDITPPSTPVAVDDMVVERIAALLHEEATAEPWTVAGVAHPGPDRDYYRGLARKVAALATQHREPTP